MFNQERTYSLVMIVALVVTVVVTFAALVHSWVDVKLFW